MTEFIDLGDGLLLSIRNVKVQTFAYDVPGYAEPVRWDISRAKAQVAAGKIVGWDEPPPAILQRIADRYEWEEAVVETADPNEVGIGAPLIWTVKAGAARPTIMYVLIDGTHRAVKALRTGAPFKVAMLTDEASRACILSGPQELIP
jgi:hypothetical protein